MSSFSANLKLEGKDFEVLDCNYSFNQNVDQEGRPAGKVFGGGITVTILGDGEDDKEVVKWMLDQNKLLKGSIEFHKLDDSAVLQKIEFEEALCGSFSEQFTANSTDSMHKTFTIFPRKVSVNGVSVELYKKK